MATRNFIHVLTESFTRDTLLKFDREKAVVSSRKNMNGDVGPALEATGLAEDRLGLLAWLFRVGAQHALRHVVQKVRSHIEFSQVAAPHRSLFPGFDRSCCAPPGTGRFARFWDHRVDEDDHPQRRARANKGRGEARERLSHENNVASFRDSADDDVRILRKTGVPIVGW